MWWLLLLGCVQGPDLPEGWGDDTRAVFLIDQSDCDGQPGDDLGVASFAASGGQVLVDWNDATFRCEQPVAGFWRLTDALEILVQPADMSGGDAANCSCRYNIDIAITEVPSGTWTARLVTRGDSQNFPNDLAVVDTTEVDVP